MATSTTQTLEDGTTIQFFDDGSTLVTDNEGNVSSSPAPSTSSPTEKPKGVLAWTEPESAANSDYQPVYPYNTITQTKGGHSFEMDDTPTRERIRLQHKSGTFTEIHPNGDEVHKIIRDGYHIVLGDHNISIGVDDGQLAKKLNITVNGDAYFYVKGNKVEQIDGSVEQYIKGDYTQTVQGIHTVTSFGNMKINAGSNPGLVPGLQSKLTIKTSLVNVSGDLQVEQALSGGYIFSKGRVDAFLGVAAGPYGFHSLLGGISIGLPTPAIPGTIVCSGPITSFSSVSAPLGTYGISSSLLGFDVINTLIRKLHIHISGKPGTPTSTSPSKELKA
jgi:hypothetical protein